MSRFVARLRYFAEDAIEEWRHSTGVTILATSTLAAVLFVAGLVVLVLFNLSSHLESWQADLRVEVFLRDGLDADGVEGVRARLEGVAGVARVAYVDKDEALRRFRRTFRALSEVPADLGVNPLPASFEAFFAPGPSPGTVARAIATSLEGHPGVEEVRYDKDLFDRVRSVLEVARWSGAALAVLVLGALVFVMAGVLRLAVYARREEVDIMLLVGATPGFVRGPFLLAGFVQGLVGGWMAILCVEIVRRLTVARAGADPAPLLDLVLGRPLPPGYAALIVAAGVGIGLVSAAFAVRRVAA